MRGVDWVVKQILGGHDTVLHLDGPHVLALALPVPWSDLGVAVHGGAHVEGGQLHLGGGKRENIRQTAEREVMSNKQRLVVTTTASQVENDLYFLTASM